MALVSQEFLTLKMLNQSMNLNLQRLLTPSFMVPEHIPMTEENNYDFKPMRHTESSQIFDVTKTRKEVD